MRNSILVVCALLLSGCGVGYDSSAYVDTAEINSLLKLSYGASTISKEGTIKVLAPKDYTLWVLKDLAKKNNYDMVVEWDRRSVALTYKADKTYDIKIHPGNSAQEINSDALSKVDVYSVVAFGKEKPSEYFSAQLKKAFEEKQKKQDPMKHVDATYVVNMKRSEVQTKIEQFLRKLYPAGKFETVIIYGKKYQTFTVLRSANNIVATADYFYYAFKELESGKTEIHLHTAMGSGTNMGNIVTNASKESSQELLNTIVQKLGL